MKYVGWFREMKTGCADSGSVKDNIVDVINYDRDKVIAYLTKFKCRGGCPRAAIDCVTGEQISPSFLVYDDGEYAWCDFLIYHVRKYNIKLPEEFIKKIGAELSTEAQ